MAWSAAPAGSPAAMTSRSFSPSGRRTAALYFVSDRAQGGIAGRWWNLFRVAGRRAGAILRNRAGVAACRRVRAAAVEFPHVDLCLRRAAPAGLQLYRKWRPSAGEGRSRHAADNRDPDDLPGHLHSPPQRWACLFSRRRAERTAGDRRTRPRIGTYDSPAALDHSGCRSLSRLSVDRGAGDLRHRQRAAGLWPVLPAAQHRFRRPGGGIAAAFGPFATAGQPPLPHRP